MTICTEHRVPIFNQTESSARAVEALNRLNEAGDWDFLAGVVMPDHLHALFGLGPRLPLDRVIAKWKTRTRPAGAAWRWQANAYEHRLRPDEDTEDYALYIFLNPYRAGLLAKDQTWPWWRRNAPWQWKFEAALGDGAKPPIAWYQRVESLAQRWNFAD